MQLLHHEINVEPGQEPKQDVRKSGAVGFGRAVLRLENKSKLINAYRVTVTCEDPRWNPDWCKLDALEPPTGEQVGAAGYRPDEIGLHREYVKVYVLAGAIRDIAIDVQVPRNPTSRAGVYQIQIVIDVSLTDQSGFTREEQRQVKEAAVIIRPYYEWTLQVSPNERKVGCFKRRERYEVQVENLGNDWLYCDVASAELEALKVECESQRIAVPPPGGSGKALRQLPMKVFHPKRIWRGGKQQYHLQVGAVRVDAPTVPPLSERAIAGDADANSRAAVIARDTRDNPTRIVNVPKLTFGPLIPATLTDFFRALASSARSLLFLVIGLVLAAHIAVFLWGQIARTAFTVQPTGSWKPKEQLLVHGNYVTSAIIDVIDPQHNEVILSERVEPLVHGQTGALGLNWDDRLAKYKKVILRAHFVPHFFDHMSFIMPTQANQPVVEIVGGGPTESGFMLLTIPPAGEPYRIPVHGVPPDQFPLYVEVDGTVSNTIAATDIKNGSIEIPSPGPNHQIRILDQGKNPLTKIAADVPPTATPATNDQQQGLITTPISGGGSEGGSTSGGSTSGGSDGTGGSGGNRPGADNSGTGQTAAMPLGYDHAIAALTAEAQQNSKLARVEFQAVVDQGSGSRNPSDQALVALAQAALGHAAESRSALDRANGADEALRETVLARLSEISNDIPGVRDHFGKAEALAPRGSTLLPTIADAGFEVRQQNSRNARQALSMIGDRSASQSEQAAIGKLKEITAR